MFHINKAVFQILWTVIQFFFHDVFPILSQPAVYFDKSPSQMKIDEKHLFEEQLERGALLMSSPNKSLTQSSLADTVNRGTQRAHFYI